MATTVEQQVLSVKLLSLNADGLPGRGGFDSLKRGSVNNVISIPIVPFLLEDFADVIVLPMRIIGKLDADPTLDLFTTQRQNTRLFLIKPLIQVWQPGMFKVLYVFTHQGDIDRCLFQALE